MNRFLRLLFFSSTLIVDAYAQTPDANGIVYIKTGATGTGNSWADASGDLSDALKAATTNTAIKQIWVSGGTWLPDYPADFSSTDSRDKTFLVVKDVKLYGGFAGTETSVTERNLSLTANKTILSGDLGIADDPNDNAYHVMMASGDVGTAEINGVTIMKGTTTNGSSTNALAVNGNNVMRIGGGGMMLHGASPVLNNVIFCGNNAVAGAGIYIGYSSSPIISNCIISGNYASINGSGNGGAIFAYQSTPILTNVVIAGNNAATAGGALAISSSILAFNNSIIYGNGTSTPIYVISGSYVTQYTMVQGLSANSTNHNPASTDPRFVDAPSSATAPFTGGDYSLTFSSPLIDIGSNSLYTGLSATSTDLVGKPRVANYSTGGVIDLGAIEYQPPLTQTITVADAVKTYGDADFEPVASASSGLAVTLQSSDPGIAQPYIDVSDGNKWKIALLKAGVATVTVSQPGNAEYAAATAKTFTVTVNKAALVITASDLTKTYDGLSFSGGNGVTYSGFVNGEDATSALTGTLTYMGTSQGATAANSYTIIPSGLTATNYDITYTAGTLTINKAALVITASDLTKTYDGLSFSGGNGVSYSGFVNGEDATAALTGTLAYMGTSQGATAANSYTIIPSGLTATNYDITYTAGTLTINKAALVITASDLTKTYDGLSFSGGNGVTYSGFVNGEDATAALTGTLTYMGTSQGATAANSYTIIPSGLTATNYDITYTAGTLTINKATLTITADNKTRCFGVANPSFTFTSNGWVNGEGITELIVQPVSTTIATAATTAGNYDIIFSGATAPNYTITYVNGTLSIYALPTAALMATEGTVLCGNNATLALTASGNDTYQWLLDNSPINGGETGTLSITATGVYTAIATDGNGCTANATNTITVTRLLPPTVAFNFNTYCVNTAIAFTNTSDIHASGTVDYTWNSGDGQTDNNTDVYFTYTTPGDFTVSLTATPQECPSLAVTSVQTINIASQPAATRLPATNTTSGLPTQLSARNLAEAVYTWSPSTGLSDVSVYNPITTLQSSQEYQIQMVFPSGCITTDTLLVNTRIRYDIIAANAFTPNGDGKNDVFKVNLRGIKEFMFLRIYDRWGNKVYQTTDPARGWDGRYGGVLQQAGTYIWNAEAIDTNGKTIQREGVLTLLR